MDRGNNNGDPLEHNAIVGMIRVPGNIRQMLKENFEPLDQSEAEYFFQMLGTINI